MFFESEIYISYHEFSVDVKLLVERRPIADSDGLAPLITIQVVEFLFRNLSLAPDGIHDSEPAIIGRGLLEYGIYKLHVGIGLFREPHP